MSASDHIGKQFKISQAQANAISTWNQDYEPEETGFTQTRVGNTNQLSVHNLDYASSRIHGVAQSMVYSDDPDRKFGAGAHATARSLHNLAWYLKDQHDIANMAGVMVGGKLTK
jgi:hypothetical protein